MVNRLLCLGWHNIEPTPFYPAEPSAGRGAFERQLAKLARFTNVISYADAVDRIECGAPLPSRAVVLTFDDGYQDALDAAVPILTRYGLPATFFLAPHLLSGTIGAWWEDLADVVHRARADVIEHDGVRYELGGLDQRRRVADALGARLKDLDREARVEIIERFRREMAPDTPSSRRLFMNWDGARALVGAGFDVGSHTLNHPILSRETEESQRAEVAGSRTRLEEGLDRIVDTFAYPNGGEDDYDATTIRCVRDAGYRGAVTTRWGLARRGDSPYEMKRVVVSPHTEVRQVLKKAARSVERQLRAGLPV